MSRTQLLAFIGRKGGITKSTCASNAGAMLGAQGYRVVLVESDGQGSMSSMVGLPVADDFYHLLQGGDWNDLLARVPPSFAGAGEMWILRSHNAQMVIAEQQSTGNAILDRFEELRALDWADFILVDTSPDINAINNAWFYVADWLLLPTLCERPSIDKLRDETMVYVTTSQANGAQSRVRGIIPNRYEEGNGADLYSRDLLVERHGSDHHIFPVIRNAAIWKTAAHLKMSMVTMKTHPTNRYFRRKAAVAYDEFLPVVESIVATVPAEVS